MEDCVQESYSRQASIKRRVTVHVTFIKIGEIDTLKELFEADVLIRSKWREPELDNTKPENCKDIDFGCYWNPKLFIENTVGESKVKANTSLDLSPDGEAYLTERRRVTGKFMEQLELWEFPFDVQDLSVCIMSDVESVGVELVEDPKEIHRIYKQSFIDEQEWYLYKYIESVQSELPSDRADPSTTKCSLTVRCRAARRPAYFLWNIFSVTFLICCLAFVTFAVQPSLPQNRLQLSFTLVLTAVAFKFVVNQCLPKVSYLTYLDRYILTAMVILACVCFWHGIQTIIPEDSRSDADRIAICIFTATYVLYNIGFWAKIYIKPYRKRRDMKMKERRYVETVRAQAQKKAGRPRILRRQLHKRNSSASPSPGVIRNEHIDDVSQIMIQANDDAGAVSV